MADNNKENNQSLQAVILAGGESLRFWPLNSRHKSLLRIMGKPLIWYTIDGLRKIGVEDIVIVQGSKRDIEEELKNFAEIKNISYAIQPEPNGMSEAMIEREKPYQGAIFRVIRRTALIAKARPKRCWRKAARPAPEWCWSGRKPKIRGFTALPAWRATSCWK